MKIREISFTDLIDEILKDDQKSISVDSGGDEADVIKSKSKAEIVEAVDAVEEAKLLVYVGDELMGWFLIMPELDDEETIADYSANEFCQGFMETAD